MREIADTYRFFFKTPREDKEIVFYAEHRGDWPFFEGIVKDFLATHSKKIAYITSDAEDPIFGYDPRISTFYNKVLAPFFMAFLNAKVCVMTVPDLDHLGIRRSANPVHYIYVMHTLVSTFRTYRANALDAYDAIFCAGPHQIEEIRRREELAGLKPKILVRQGYPRLEEVYRQYQEYQKTHRVATIKTVLIAPSWGADNVLESCGEVLVGTLLGEGYMVIVRPHPETMRKSPELVAGLKKKFGGNKNFILEDSIATIDSLLKADILICDMSGIAFEYAWGTERPVLFIDVPLKVINPDYEKLGLKPIELTLRPELGLSIAHDDIKNIDGVIKKLFSEADHYKKKLADLRSHYVFNFGESSKIGAEYILSKTKTAQKA